MSDTHRIILIIPLHVNGLNNPTERQRLSGWIKKKSNHTLLCTLQIQSSQQQCKGRLGAAAGCALSSLLDHSDPGRQECCAGAGLRPEGGLVSLLYWKPPALAADAGEWPTALVSLALVISKCWAQSSSLTTLREPKVGFQTLDLLSLLNRHLRKLVFIFYACCLSEISELIPILPEKKLCNQKFYIWQAE